MVVRRPILSVLRTFNQSKNLHLYKNLLSKVSFNLSDIGEGIREVVVKEWYVKQGDKVAQFDNICEVQSDKASVTITSRYDGVISKLHYNVDDTAFVGKPLIDIETESETKDSSSESSSSDSDKPQDKLEALQKNETIKEGPVQNIVSNSDIQCIPSVRRLAKEHNLDLSKINATGKNGRILKEDVLKFLQGPSQDTPRTTRTTSIQKDVPTTEPIKGFKKIMIKTMTEALKIPHFVYGDEILLTELSKLRNVLKMKHSRKISSMPFFVKALSNSLTRYPIINSSVDENVENIVYHKAHNIGIAVDTDVGLAVPVIKNVQNMSIIEINEELQRFIKEGKSGKFSPQDLTGGTFTISNIGPIGGTHLKPVILPPQVAILAVGKSQVLPRFDENRNVIAEEIVSISASADHRVIDGATMARFCRDIKNQLENPYLLFLNI